jgi:hypothetical protein
MNELTKGKFYTLKELTINGLKFYKKFSNIVLYKKNKYIYWLENNGEKYKLSTMYRT